MRIQEKRTVMNIETAYLPPAFNVENTETVALTGRTLSIGGESEGDLLCLLRLPTSYSTQSKILVAVHGISRNPIQQLAAFAQTAERNDAVLIAPHFTKKDWHGYQTLVCDGVKPRCDRALIHSVDLIRSELGLARDRFFLFGFSGGGQFAHRFAFVNPGMVEAVTTVAAGWYTLPDPDAKYPLGLDARGRPLSESIDQDALLSVRYQVMVGDEDSTLDRNLRLDPDVVASQGTTRIERAEKWVESMSALGLATGKTSVVQFRRLPGIGHSFQQFLEDGGLCERVEEFFFSG